MNNYNLTLRGDEGRRLLRFLDNGATFDKIETPYNRPTSYEPAQVNYALTADEAKEIRKAAREMAKSPAPYHSRAAKSILAQI